MTKIENVKDEINKKFGEGSLFLLSDAPMDVDTISTGVIGLDLALGVGGWPKGRVIEVHGPESSGKSTLAQLGIVEGQAKGLPGLFVDMEHSLDTKYASALGMDLSQVLVSQPKTGEQALEIAERGLEFAGVVVVDSIPSLIPQSRLEGEVGDKNYGDVAHLLSRTLPRLKIAAKEHGGVLIFLNQMRVDQKGFSPYPNYQPMKTFGGEAMKFFADVRVSLKRRLEKESKEEQQTIIANVIKNKVAPPFQNAEFVLEYGVGVDKMRDLVTVATEKGVIKKKGGWLSYGNIKQNGQANFIAELNDKLAKEIRGKLDA